MDPQHILLIDPDSTIKYFPYCPHKMPRLQLLEMLCLGLQFLVSGILCLCPVFLSTNFGTDLTELSLFLFISVSVTTPS